MARRSARRRDNGDEPMSLQREHQLFPDSLPSAVYSRSPNIPPSLNTKPCPDPGLPQMSATPMDVDAANVDAPDVDGRRPLQHAALAGDT